MFRNLTVKFIIGLLMSTLLLSCPDIFPLKHYEATFPGIPVDMGDINSVYDDYNSASPVYGTSTPLCFSTNRKSLGQNFDIIYKLLDVYMMRKDGILHVSENTGNSGVDNYELVISNANLANALIKLNTGSDELGPYLIPRQLITLASNNGPLYYQQYIILYASNEPGNFNIRFTQNVSSTNYSDPKDIEFLNSPVDDLYPSLSYDSSEIYFCSNRGGDFDIYHTSVNPGNDLIAAFSDTTQKAIVKDTILSSPFDDKCPYIIGNLMVLVSNRQDGFGRFDLYYSIYKNGKWSSPVNFGDKINTAYDEYRPVVKIIMDFTNDFMIFSSDRKGGKGGFDLYYAGIDKMTGLDYSGHFMQ